MWCDGVCKLKMFARRFDIRKKDFRRSNWITREQKYADCNKVHNNGKININIHIKYIRSVCIGICVYIGSMAGCKVSFLSYSCEKKKKQRRIKLPKRLQILDIICIKKGGLLSFSYLVAAKITLLGLFRRYRPIEY